MKFQCQTCGKIIKHKRGRLKCCGHDESLKDAVAENKRHQRAVSKGVSIIVDKMFLNDNPYSDEYEDCIFEIDQYS